MIIENGKEYPTFETEKLFQCILNGGTASIFVKTQGLSGFTKVKEFTQDEVVKVHLPIGSWKVETTGAAEVGASI